MSAEAQKVNLNIEEMKNFISYIVKNNQHLQANNKKPVAIEVEGESGIGKTSTMVQIAQESGFHMVKINLAQIEELGDLVGFPVRQFQLCKEGVKPAEGATVKVKRKVKETKKVKKSVMGEDGKATVKEVEMEVEVEREFDEPAVATDECRWIDEKAVDEYLKQGYSFTGEKRMSYCPPEWIANKPEGGFLLLDDWNRADIRFIQAVMELVDRQEYISWKMPKNWHIVLTANPDNGEYLVQSIDVAQRTRFISVSLKFDVQVWARWAETEKIDGRCINFMMLHPELVSAKVNPRSITTFFNAISSIPDFSKELPLIQQIGEGSVGPEFSTLFTSFINNKLDKLTTPHDMLFHDNEAYIIGELRNCIGRGDSYRADIASVLTTRLINYTVNYSQDNSVDQKVIDRLIKLMTDEETFTNDLKYLMVKKILNGNKQKFQKLMANQEVVKMSLK